MFQYKPEITKKFLYQRLSEEDIFHRYLGIYPKLKIDYKNPLRKDDFDTCQFYKDNRGILKFKDFSKGWNWDCINVVQYIYNVKYQEALKIIAKDFNLITYGTAPTPVTRIYTENAPEFIEKKVFKIRTQSWTSTDIKYWKSWGINSDILKKYQVYSVLAFWVDDILKGKYQHGDPIYAYYFDNGDYKLYFPFRNKRVIGGRFRSNNNDVLQGSKQLPKTGENLIVTKAYKDVMCLDLFDIPAVAPSSESIILTQVQYDGLSKRFNNIYSLMDNDKAGRTMAVKLRMAYKIKPLMFSREDYNEGIKDFSDHIKIRGIQETIDLVEYAKTQT